MPSLTDVLQVLVPDTENDPEDIFASAPGLIFTDDLVNLHGSPEATIIYKSTRFGELELHTADPSAEEERKLFSHYLWNAGLKLAELIRSEPAWSVLGEDVLELGSGVGLGGIVACLAGAKHVSHQVLENLSSNVTKNLPLDLRRRCAVEGHAWGSVDTGLAVTHKTSFTRILAADCFWMLHQHNNLITSMLHFLSPAPSARILIVAGFHTGRSTLAAFFDQAQSRGFGIEDIYEEDAEGSTRAWDPERGGGTEDHTERKKWLVNARLMLRPTTT